jgi:hypothetical protein
MVAKSEMSPVVPSIFQMLPGPPVAPPALPH